MSENPRIGIVSLGEAGNLGDDLILIAAVQAVRRALPHAAIRYLSYGQRLDWASLDRRLNFGEQPLGVSRGRDLPGSTKHSRTFTDEDVVIFGGGGLLQTSHHPDRPFQWLNYLPPVRRRVRILAVGLGLGPIADSWKSALRTLGSPFDATFVRDEKSLKLATENLDWSAEQCRDFVDEEFLQQFWEPRQSAVLPSRLGIALRAWPGLSAERVARHVRHVAAQHSVENVSFFVLEDKNGHGIDVDFSASVRDLVPELQSEMFLYRGKELEEFITQMTTCTVSISMKLHSSAVWAALGVPMYPIVYAPKIAALFGLNYDGLAIEDQIVAPAPDAKHVPRSAEVVSRVLPRLLDPAASIATGGIGANMRLKFQLRGAWAAVKSRLSRGSRRGRR